MTQSIWVVSEFLDSLATVATRKNYKSGLKKFFAFISGETFPARGYDPRVDEISLNYFTGDNDYAKDYVAYQNEIKHKYAPKTVGLRMLVVRGLFEFNQIVIPKAILIRVNGRKAVEPISEEKVPSREEMKRILQHLPLHMKSYVLFLLSGGFRPAEPLSLKLCDLEEDGELLKVNIPAKSTKTGRKRWTYITPEARQSLELWSESRERFIESKLQSKTINATRQRYWENSRDKIFPFTYNNANQVWKNALKRAGLFSQDSKTNRVSIRLHNLRKYFSTRGNWNNNDITDFLQGHISGIRAVYARYDQAEQKVKEAYLVAIPSLTIEEYADSGKVEKLESQIAESELKSREMTGDVTYLVRRNRDLTTRIVKLEVHIEEMLPAFRALTHQLEARVEWEKLRL